MSDLSTVAQLARYTGVSGTTIRNWSAEFADYLSEHANPPKGTERRFTAEDIDVLATVATMREQLQDYGAIRRALDAGTRLTPPDHEVPSQGSAAAPPTLPRVVETAITAHLARIAVLEQKIEDLTERLIAAEKRATAAEAKLEVLQSKQ